MRKLIEEMKITGDLTFETTSGTRWFYECILHPSEDTIRPMMSKLFQDLKIGKMYWCYNACMTMILRSCNGNEITLKG